MAGVRGLSGWVGTVLGAPDARAPAEFYQALLGWEVVGEDPHFVAMAIPDSRANLAFQTEEYYERPTWPGEAGRQGMMLHLDIGVRALDPAVADAVALGAELAEFQPQDDVRVLLDPAGHPFCLYLDRD